LKKAATHLIIALIKAISWLPFPLLYFLSDLLRPLMYYCIRYRKKVVFVNLRKSFPEKPEEEIRQMAKGFYKHLCDLFFETLKVGSMNKKSLSLRMRVRGFEKLNDYFTKGRSVVLLATHYGNWEWLAILPVFLKHKTVPVYKPLQNELFDRYQKKNREKFGASAVPMALTLRIVVEAEERSEPIALGLAADQTPLWNHKFWTLFFHQEAMFFNGPARIAQRYNLPLFFEYTRKVSRGKYETGFELLFENPADVDEVTLIKTYVQKLEALIREKPEYYLWSHRRWKHKRRSGLPLY